jgi:hypothetical protein
MSAAAEPGRNMRTLAYAAMYLLRQQGEYQISKRWSVSASRDQYGGFAVNGKFHKSF